MSRRRVVAVAIGAWIGVDVLHELWHYFYADATAAEVVVDLSLTAAIAALLIVPFRRGRRVFGATVLLLAGAYSVLRGISGTFFTDEQAWPHVLLGLSGVLALMVGTSAFRAQLIVRNETVSPPARSPCCDGSAVGG
jgi:hypothetical protein